MSIDLKKQTADEQQDLIATLQAEMQAVEGEIAARQQKASHDALEALTKGTKEVGPPLKDGDITAAATDDLFGRAGILRAQLHLLETEIGARMQEKIRKAGEARKAAGTKP